MPKLRAVIATPLPEALCHLIARLEPRLDLVWEQSLLPPERWPADYTGDPAWRRSPDEQARFEAMVDSAQALYGIPDVDPDALARTVRANADLRWVQTMAAGGGADVRRAGLSRAELDRIIFTTSAGVHGGTLSEFALFGLFCGAKGLPGLTAFKAGRQWTGRWPMAQVSEWTVLVAGLGGIGQELAAKLTALGARVIGVSLRGRPVPGVERVYGPGDLVTAAAGADAIVSTLPGTEATNGLIGADVLAALKPGATVVSVGRGTVFDEPALIAALKSGQVGFAALDVFAVEPLPPESELWDLPNVVMTPHTAANSPHEQRRIAELFARNATALLDGRPLANVVDTLHFY